jgi:malate/lactate dehydrogenase
MTIWGNHSSTQVPDFIHARLKGKPAEAVIQDRHWLEQDFMQLVQKRGAAIIQARGKSSAASAAHALLECVRDTLHPTRADQWYSLALASDGNPYGIEDQLIFSFPCQTREQGTIAIVSGLDIHEFLDAKLKATERELLEEREFVKSLIK